MIKISYNIIVKIKIEVAIMCGLRSITLGTEAAHEKTA